MKQTDSQVVETDRDRRQDHHPSTHKNFKIEEVVFNHQVAPQRTNITHNVRVHKPSTDQQGHHYDQRAIKHRLLKQSFNVDQYQSLYEQMNATHVPYDMSMKAIVRHFCKNIEHGNDPFYIVDLSHFSRQYMQWEKFLPRVKPFYGTVYISMNEFTD